MGPIRNGGGDFSTLLRLGLLIVAFNLAAARPGLADDESPDEKSDEPPAAAEPPARIERDGAGFDIIPGWRHTVDPAGADAERYAALRAARVDLKFGIAEHGHLKQFDAAARRLDAADPLAGATLGAKESESQLEEAVRESRKEMALLRGVSAATLFGRFPLIRAFGLQVGEDSDFYVESFSAPGLAERSAVRSALLKIAKSASSDPLHVVTLVPRTRFGGEEDSRLAAIVDGEAPLAFSIIPDVRQITGSTRRRLDPMPAWDAPDPAFAPLCRQFRKVVNPVKEPRSIMFVMLREFIDEEGDGYWVQTQQRTFGLTSLADLDDKPEDLEADKVRVSESLTRDRSRFRFGIVASLVALFGLAVLVHALLSRLIAPHPGGWSNALLLPGGGFLIGLVLTPLIVSASQRGMPAPEAPYLAAAWWPCTAGALSLLLPVGVFRLVAGSAARYVPGTSCHGRWGVAFVPVALGASAAWVRPACYEFGIGCVPLVISIVAATGLLVYCFGRAIDLADHFPVGLVPVAIGLALIFGGSAFLGSSLLVTGVAVVAGGMTAAQTIARRRDDLAAGAADSLVRPLPGQGRRPPRTLAELQVALDQPLYQPPPEFQQLRQFIEQARMTKSVWIGLVGPSAAGKTAAARQIIGELQHGEGELQVLAGRCVEAGTPYHPLREAFAPLGLATGLMAARSQRGDINSIFERLADEFIPLWDFFSGVADDDDEDDEAPRPDLMAAVTNALRALLKSRRVALFIDDVQWLDEGSAAVIRHLHENFAPGTEGALLIILAGRDAGPLEQFELQDAVVALSSPSEADQQRILQRSFGIEAHSARHLVKALGILSQEAGGLFWLIRAVGDLANEQAFAATPRGFVLKRSYLADGHLPVPVAMRAKLGESLRASGENLHVLEFAALLGETFRVDELAECLTMERLELLQILRRLERELQLVRDLPADPDCYAFSSSFLHEIVRDELQGIHEKGRQAEPSSKIARAMHARIAQVLESRSPHDLEQTCRIAQHYRQAGREYALQAVKYCLAAARMSARNGAQADARRFLDLAESSAADPEAKDSVRAARDRIGRGQGESGKAARQVGA